VGQSASDNALMARNYLSFKGLHAGIASLLGGDMRLHGRTFGYDPERKLSRRKELRAVIGIVICRWISR